MTLRVRGLRLEGDQPVPIDVHEVEIRLPVGYPREKPACVPLTPVFHPNIKDYYCIQDYWAAGQPLVDTIAKLADMIQFRSYNPGSPLDGVAARWARQNAALFPIGNVALSAPEVAIVFGRHESAAAVTSDASTSEASLMPSDQFDGDDIKQLQPVDGRADEPIFGGAYAPMARDDEAPQPEITLRSRRA